MLAQGAGLPAKTTPPKSVAENYYVVMAYFVFILGQCPALFSLRSQQGKQICRNTSANETFGFLVSGTSSMLTSLFPILATEYAHLTPAQAGALYLITPALAFTGPLWGLLSDRVSRSLVLAVRSIANAGSALIYLFAPSLSGIWIGTSLDDLGKAAYRPAWGSLMADISSQDPSRRGRTMGYLTAG